MECLEVQANQDKKNYHLHIYGHSFPWASWSKGVKELIHKLYNIYNMAYILYVIVQQLSFQLICLVTQCIKKYHCLIAGSWLIYRCDHK